MYQSQRVPFSIEPTARSLYFILIQPKGWHFCDKIKLSIVVDEKTSIHKTKNIYHRVPRAKPCISTLSLRTNEHRY